MRRPLEKPEFASSIVLIEDDPNVSVMLTKQLERQGWSVRAVGSLNEARKLLSSTPWDLLLLDRGLPDGDGVELCAEIRASAHHGYIIMLTGESSDQSKLEGFYFGADDYVTKPFQIEELFARIQAGLRIVHLQKALLASNRQLEELSLTDGLTRLRNRRAFDQELATRFEHARRYERPISVAVIDIDHFKLVNDALGHQAGDAALSEIAGVLESATRITDFVARYGGEEFAVILPETGLTDAIRFADKIRDSVAEMTPNTISIGVASMPHSMFSSPDELVRAADEALYRAKKNGRNRIEAEKRNVALRPAGSQPLATLLRSDRRLLQQ